MAKKTSGYTFQSKYNLQKMEKLAQLLWERKNNYEKRRAETTFKHSAY